MAWIESHTVLIRHRKLIEFAKDLVLMPVYAIGHLHALWYAALEQQEDGDLSGWSDQFIAESSCYVGDSELYVRSLQKHGWLDGKIIHDWFDYAGRYLSFRYRTSNPKRLSDIAKKYAKSDFSQTAGRTLVRPAVCPPTYLPTYLTYLPKERVRFQRPTPQEVEAYAKTQNCRINGQQFCDYYEAGGWRRGNTPIKSWKACVRTWKSREPAKSQTYGISPAIAATNAREAQERSKLMALEVELKADLDRIKALPKERQSEIRVRATKLIPPDMKYGIESILLPQAMVDVYREMGRPS